MPALKASFGSNSKLRLSGSMTGIGLVLIAGSYVAYRMRSGPDAIARVQLKSVAQDFSPVRLDAPWGHSSELH